MKGWIYTRASSTVTPRAPITSTPTSTTLQWTAVPSRFYAVQEQSSLTNDAWINYLSHPLAGWNNLEFNDYDNTNEFFRVRAYRPLMP